MGFKKNLAAHHKDCLIFDRPLFMNTDEISWETPIETSENVQ